MKLWIQPPFYCDYGTNIKVGDQVWLLLEIHAG